MLKSDTEPADTVPPRDAGNLEHERGAPVVRTMPALAFAAWLEQRHYAPATVRVYGVYVERLLGALDAAGIPAREATIDDLYTFWCSLPASAASRNQARKASIAFFRSLGVKTGAPADELPMLPEPYGVPRPVDASDFARLTGAARELGGIHEVIGLTLAHTGCRISELRTARWAQFELRAASPTWNVRGKGSGRRGPKERQIPLRQSLVPVLTRWERDCGSTAVLFPSATSRSGVICDSKMRSLVYELAEAAGLDRVVPHRFRHTAATNALAAQSNLRDVQEFLGHASLATTQRYTQVLPGRLVDLVERLPD